MRRFFRKLSFLTPAFPGKTWLAFWLASYFMSLHGQPSWAFMFMFLAFAIQSVVDQAYINPCQAEFDEINRQRAHRKFQEDMASRLLANSSSTNRIQQQVKEIALFTVSVMDTADYTSEPAFISRWNK
ncbi:hypothetical protein [Enterobacter soli]|uniref:hypothetical protein n=1 Tax=Enterobacter soli TaxID=885040 RepID=UPI002F4186E4